MEQSITNMQNREKGSCQIRATVWEPNWVFLMKNLHGSNLIYDALFIELLAGHVYRHGLGPPSINYIYIYKKISFMCDPAYCSDDDRLIVDFFSVDGD